MTTEELVRVNERERTLEEQHERVLRQVDKEMVQLSSRMSDAEAVAAARLAESVGLATMALREVLGQFTYAGVQYMVRPMGDGSVKIMTVAQHEALAKAVEAFHG